MTDNELQQVVAVIDKDQKYSHFITRIQKDFSDSQTKGIPVAMRAFFVNDNGKQAGFAIVCISPLKMREWEKTFLEEGWGEDNFVIDISSFELMYLYVKPGARRKGIGAQLFNKVFGYAKRVGIKKIYAYVSDTTDAGLKFYLKQNATVLRNFSSSEEDQTTTAFLVWDCAPKTTLILPTD